MATLSVYMLTLIVLSAAAATALEIANPGECQQTGRQRVIRSCRRYLRDSQRIETESGGWREEFPRCCEELEQISEECRCHAIKELAQEAVEAGELQGRELGEMLQTAQSLPNLCRIPPHYCQSIRGPSIF